MGSTNPQKNFDWGQFFPPKPEFTDADLPSDLSGKIYIVTGANTGMGKELSRVLYARDAKVYVACRSRDRATQAIADIQKQEPASQGQLVFLPLDLADLDSVRAAGKEFLAKEQQLHVLFNNAAVMTGAQEPPPKTKQGLELGLGVNCVGTFLFTRLVTPRLVATARTEAVPSTVRVVWTASFAVEQYAPRGRGIDMSNLDYSTPMDGLARYGLSKAGDWLLAVEYAKRYKADGVVSVAMNPGNLRTEIARDQGLLLKIVEKTLAYPLINGVYTLLFSGFSKDVTLAGDWTKNWSKSRP